ncbi:MAG TPA: hypothetical protein P5539_05765 [Mesotoga sp.]|nr:hypothetical protein [Mesotoga sp.]
MIARQKNYVFVLMQTSVGISVPVGCYLLHNLWKRCRPIGRRLLKIFLLIDTQISIKKLFVNVIIVSFTRSGTNTKPKNG